MGRSGERMAAVRPQRRRQGRRRILWETWRTCHAQSGFRSRMLPDRWHDTTNHAPVPSRWPEPGHHGADTKCCCVI